MFKTIEFGGSHSGQSSYGGGSSETEPRQGLFIYRSLSFMGFAVASLFAILALGFPGDVNGSMLKPLIPDPEPAAAVTVNISSAVTGATPGRQPANAGLPYTRSENVVYGYRDGMATIMDVFTPKAAPNGAGVIIFVSAKYGSGQELLRIFHPITSMPFLDRGYVVFQVMHSSQPRYTVLEIVEDAHRAVRFIKQNAKKYGIDPAKIGVAGASSGGHLSLMMGCAGTTFNSTADDPVDRQSSRAAAVACYFPPSDFPALAESSLKKEILAPFDFRQLDPKTGLLERVSAKRQMEIAGELSPINHVAKGAAPTLIIHGDEDDVVPITQSEAMIKKLKGCNVESELKVMKGKKHFQLLWVVKELPTLADWFDKHLLK